MWDAEEESKVHLKEFMTVCILTGHKLRHLWYQWWCWVGVRGLC